MRFGRVLEVVEGVHARVGEVALVLLVVALGAVEAAVVGLGRLEAAHELLSGWLRTWLPWSMVRSSWPR